MIFKRGNSINYTVRTRWNGKVCQFPTHQSNPDTARRLEREFREKLALEDVGLALPERLKPKEAKAHTIGMLLDALETDLRLRRKLSGKSARKLLSNLGRAKRDFGKFHARAIASEDVDRYIEKRIAEGAAPASVNRVTQVHATQSIAAPAFRAPE
jgi:hypothetical protein